MRRLRAIELLLPTLTLGVVTNLFVQHVRAAGIPTKGPLTYTGYLEDDKGTPVTNEQMIGLAAYDSSTVGTKVCEVEAKPIAPVGGRLQIPLPDACLAAVSANPELWIEVSVGAIPLGRTKLGAVPYTVEAGHAVSADLAATAAKSTAGLDERIAKLEGDITALQKSIQPKSAALYHKTKPDVWGGNGAIVSIPDKNDYPVMFDVRDYHIASELQSDMHTFKVAEPGYYVVACGAVVSGGANGLYIYASGRVRASSDSFNHTTSVAAVVRLDAGGTIECVLSNYTGKAVSIDVGASYTQTGNFVSVARLYP